MEKDEKYQIMPPLTDEEYERLKTDIAENGIAAPIDVDENGNILDGYHRAQACKELGIECPTRTCFNLTEEEKYEYALRININRRQLSGERLQEVILKFKEEHPGYSNSRIAEATGVDDHTVAATIKKCSGSEIPNVDTVEGSDGKKYPASEKEAEEKRAAVRGVIADDPKKSDRQIAKETGTSPTTVGAQRKKMKTVTNPSKRDKEALKDPDIRRRIVENEGMTVAGAIREQKRERLAAQPDTNNDKGIKVDITQTNNIPEVNGVRIVRAGITEDLGTKAEMYNMDCLAYMGALPDESVDLIVADPPYFEVWGDFDFVWKSEDEYLEWIYKCLHEFSRILKPTGTLMLWGTLGGSHLTLCKIMLLIEENGLFIKKNTITQRNTRGTGVQDNYMNCREDLLFYTKSDSYTFNVPYTDEISDRTDLGANDMPRGNDYKRASNVWCDIAEASQSSIERNFHPTTKALKLCSRIIETHSNEGDLVYIPFTGSGSEIVSCIKSNRDFIGTELNEEYFTKSIDRIKQLLEA